MATIDKLLITLILPASLCAQEPGTIVEFNESVRDFTSNGTGYSDVDLADYFRNQHSDVATWYQHVNTLANPWMEGRQPGTRGDDLATEYIEFHLEHAGLSPAFTDEEGNPSWKQPFSFQLGRQSPTLVSSNVLIDGSTMVHSEDYTVLANSGNGSITAPLTFVGYSIEDGEDGYDSFGEDDDLSGRIAVMLRYEPLDATGISRWADENFSGHSGITQKMQALLDRNAAGVIMVTPPKALDGRRGLETLRSSRGYRPRAEVPVIHLSSDQADTLLSSAHPKGLGLAELRKAADRDRMDTYDLPDDWTITIQTQLEDPGIKTRNVAGVIPGRGDLADEWLIIGGHYDHIGTGYVGSRQRNSNKYHNGADDNASGIASLLVVADRLSTASEKNDGDRRSVMVIGFGAEEAGLHGSKFFVDNPSMDLDKVSCMLNFDMMGRVSEKGVQVLGTGTAEEFDEMLPRHVAESPLVVHATPSGTGPSDHSTFYRKDIPVMFFFSGITDEYHTPEDYAWTVNPQGAVEIINLATGIAEEIIVRDDILTYRASDSSSPRRGTGSRVRLGIMPGYAAEIETGVMVDGVSKNTAAAKAGLKTGDIMVGWNDKDLKGPGELMQLLRESSPGDTIEVTVLRDGETSKLSVTLQGIDE
ncbi:MAG: M28 family peptidase [Phycisphaerales bacterium]|nr:M28 family peptidase [Phycisphaerales bacterium]